MRRGKKQVNAVRQLKTSFFLELRHGEKEDVWNARGAGLSDKSPWSLEASADRQGSTAAGHFYHVSAQPQALGQARSQE